MVRVEQEHAQQRSTRPRKLTSVTNENILIQAKQDYFDDLLDLKDYQQRLCVLGYRYIKATPPPPPKKSIFVKKMKIEINAWKDSPSSALSETL